MIDRYDCPEISEIWNDTNKYRSYLEVELALLKALEGKKIPEGTEAIVREKSVISPERVNEIEKVTKHDVIAFCTSITENLPKDVSKFFHFGCTSSDIIDTATTLQIKQSVSLCLKQLKKLQESLLKKAQETKHIVCMGRSHGMNAEPMSFGQKFLSFYAEISRRYEELLDFFTNELTGQLSGAVGNYTVLDPEIEKDAMDILGLKVEPVGSQVIPRDRIAKLISINSLIASAMERIAVEIRHLHHSDIGELYEGFSKGQKGSSTMPHKKNPISGENITGMARMIRSHLTIAHENIPLWHERDISHSSAERMMLPDNLGLLFYSLRRLSSTVDNLVINEEVIQQKVLGNFTYLSSYVLHKLIETQDATREEIYAVVQQAAFDASNVSEFVAAVKAKFDVDMHEIEALDLDGIKSVYMDNIDAVFTRVIESYQAKD
jgi:adenylosuccinate lyase